MFRSDVVDRMAVRVGRLPGVLPRGVFLQHRDGVMVHGPTGAGKTWSLAYWLVMNAPRTGSVLASTTGADLVASTWSYRKTCGPVHVLDPEGLTGHPGTIRWSPLSGCEDPVTAIRRAEALTAALPIRGAKNSDYFEGKAAVLLRCYLHAAAISGSTIRDVKAWANTKGAPLPRQILQNSPDRDVQDWADDLAVIVDSPADSSHDVVNSAKRLLEPLANPALMRAMDVPKGQGFDVEAFLREPTTLYLLSDGTSASVAPFVSALAAEVMHQAVRLSQTLPAKRLDPALRFVLDEFNNVAPIPHFPKRLTDTGKRGITLWAFAHSQAQNLERWGQAEGRSLKANTPVRLILPGLGDDEELAALSRLIGRERKWIKTPKGGQLVEVDRWPLDRIRQIPQGHGLLLYRNAPPLLVKLPDVWGSRRTAARVRAAMAEFEGAHTTRATEYVGV